MSIEFAIIPITSIFTTTAYDIQTKLNENIKLQINIDIDTNYDIPFTSRINKWKKKEYNIITIEEDYHETNTIIVRFSDKETTNQIMDIDEFIDLVSSFENEEEDNTSEHENYIQKSGCTII